MMLQAFVDDSGSDWQSNVFVLAGFVATADQWDAFNKDWHKALREPPSLACFKSNECYGLKGEFSPSKEWTRQKADDRIVTLARVIQKHLPEKFSVAISPEDYYAFVDGIPVVRPMKALENPYFMTFYEFMLAVGGVHSLWPQVMPCEFILTKAQSENGRVTGGQSTWKDCRRRSSISHRTIPVCRNLATTSNSFNCKRLTCSQGNYSASCEAD